MKRRSGVGRHEVRYARGFTLVEVLISIAILSVITGVLVMVVYQFLHIPRSAIDELAVASALRNAAVWLMRDGNESRSFSEEGTCGTFRTGHGSTYTYSLDGEAMTRTDNTGATIVVARNVSALTCDSSDGLVSVGLEMTRREVSHSRTFTVAMRVGR